MCVACSFGLFFPPFLWNKVEIWPGRFGDAQFSAEIEITWYYRTDKQCANVNVRSSHFEPFVCMCECVFMRWVTVSMYLTYLISEKINLPLCFCSFVLAAFFCGVSFIIILFGNCHFFFVHLPAQNAEFYWYYAVCALMITWYAYDWSKNLKMSHRYLTANFNFCTAQNKWRWPHNIIISESISLDF